MCKNSTSNNSGIQGNVTGDVIAVGTRSQATKLIQDAVPIKEITGLIELFKCNIIESNITESLKSNIIAKTDKMHSIVTNESADKHEIYKILSAIKSSIESVKNFIVGAGELIEPITKIAALLGIALG